MTSSSKGFSNEVPHHVLSYRNSLIDLFPDKLEEIDLVINVVSEAFASIGTEEKNRIANSMERSAIRKIDKRIKFLIEKFRDLLVLKKVIKQLKKNKDIEKYRDILDMLERSVNRDINNYAKRIAQEKIKIEAIKEYGLNRHREFNMIYLIPLGILVGLGVIRWLRRL